MYRSGEAITTQIDSALSNSFHYLTLKPFVRRHHPSWSNRNCSCPARLLDCVGTYEGPGRRGLYYLITILKKLQIWSVSVSLTWVRWFCKAVRLKYVQYCAILKNQFSFFFKKKNGPPDFRSFLPDSYMLVQRFPFLFHKKKIGVFSFSFSFFFWFHFNFNLFLYIKKLFHLKLLLIMCDSICISNSKKTTNPYKQYWHTRKWLVV